MEPATEAIMRRAEVILGVRGGRPVLLGPATRLSEDGRRNLLLRCAVLDGPAGLPPALVLKCARSEGYRPDDPDCWQAQGLFRDWAGLQLLSEHGGAASGAPRLYGGDREQGFVIMEDLGDAEDLARVLLGGGAERAQRCLVELAAALGHTHAATIGQARRYAEIRGALGPGDAATSRDEGRQVRAWAGKVVDIAAALGIPAGAGVFADVEAVAAAMDEPGPFLAYTTGDPCLDNALIDARGSVRLHDFEFGAFRHALRDGVYGRMRFPTCWCVGDIPEAVVARMQEAHRRALAAGCPAAEAPGPYRRAVAEACGFWLIANLHEMLGPALAFDRVWGVATLRQRIVRRLAAFIGAAGEAGHLTELRGFAARLHEHLRPLWGDTLPLYPAFTRTVEAKAASVEALFAAIAADEAETAENLLRGQPELASAATLDHAAVPALCRAAELGRIRHLELLLGAGALPDSAGPSGRSALALAGGNGHTEAAAVLLRRGANPQARDLAGHAPLHAAARGGHAGTIALLRERGARVDAVAAVLLRDAGALQTAVRDEPSALGARVDNGRTPLHVAAAGAGGTEMVRRLLEMGADPHARDAGAATPLHGAAEAGQTESVRLLLAGGADPGAADGQGRTPRELAEQEGHTACADVLRAAGATRPAEG